VAVGSQPFSVVVNPLANRIYVANYLSNNVTVINGATQTTSTVAVGASPVGMAVDAEAGKVYVGNSQGSSVSVIRTSGHTVQTLAVGAVPSRLSVDPLNHKVYVSHSTGEIVTIVSPGTSQALPLITALDGLADATGDATPTVRFTPSTTYTPNAPPPTGVFYRLDGSAPWLPAAPAGDGSYVATLPAQAFGTHLLAAFAVDGMEGSVAHASLQTGPVLGRLVQRAFTVTSLPDVVFGDGFE
jgi:YVTN family beta-propeller protein